LYRQIHGDVETAASNAPLKHRNGVFNVSLHPGAGLEGANNLLVRLDQGDGSGAARETLSDILFQGRLRIRTALEFRGLSGKYSCPPVRKLFFAVSVYVSLFALNRNR